MTYIFLGKTPFSFKTVYINLSTNNLDLLWSSKYFIITIDLECSTNLIFINSYPTSRFLFLPLSMSILTWPLLLYKDISSDNPIARLPPPQYHHSSAVPSSVASTRHSLSTSLPIYEIDIIIIINSITFFIIVIINSITFLVEVKRTSPSALPLFPADWQGFLRYGNFFPEQY